MAKINRNDRLNAEFQKEIYEIISRKLKNPLITEMFSVMRVDASKDLSHAKVYISIYSTNAEKKKITFGMISYAPIPFDFLVRRFSVSILRIFTVQRQSSS